MARAQEIAKLALSLAEEFMLGARQQIVDLADGDMPALFEASRIIRERAAEGGQLVSRSSEHFAFALVTAAYDRMREEHQPPAVS